MNTLAATILCLALTLMACAGPSSSEGGGQRPTPATGEAAANGSPGAPGASGAAGHGSGGEVDPREGGLEVALGEWAVTLEAGAIRPGRVTFLVQNRGTIPHGFEIETEDDSSGPGSGDEDGVKAETDLLQPGESARLTLDLPAGVYKVECLVDGHDDLGMEGFLEVRKDAPLARDRDRETEGADVAIRDFAFDPVELGVAPGDEVTWRNDDPTPHTVTADDGSFDSGTLESGQTFSVAVEGNGPVTYRCTIHPEMTGTIAVG